jgi:hypothetical protein
VSEPTLTAATDHLSGDIGALGAFRGRMTPKPQISSSKEDHRTHAVAVADHWGATSVW